MSVSYWQDRSQGTGTQNFDIVVVGGGIAGVSTAYWLAQEDPSMSIALVEKHQLGDGATGRNAGFITCGSVEHFNRLVGKHGPAEAHEIWRFSEENLKLLKDHVIQDEGPGILFAQKGSFSLASTDTEFTELKKSAEIMKGFNINVEVLEGDAIEKRLGAEKFVGGIKYVDDGSVHPIRMLNLMRKRIEQRFPNVKFFENHEVHGIDKQGEDKLVRTKGGNFATPMVVLATNAYTPLVHSYFADKIFPTRGQILATAPVPQFMEAPCYANFVLDYFRQLPTGEMIIGGFRQLQKDTEVGYSDQTTDIIQTSLEKFLQDHIPAVRGAKITHRWSGLMGFAVDGQPMVGALPTDPQINYISACTGHGLGLSFHAAKTLVDSIFGRPIPKFISGRRFS